MVCIRIVRQTYDPPEACCLGWSMLDYLDCIGLVKRILCLVPESHFSCYLLLLALILLVVIYVVNDEFCNFNSVKFAVYVFTGPDRKISSCMLLEVKQIDLMHRGIWS